MSTSTRHGHLQCISSSAGPLADIGPLALLRRLGAFLATRRRHREALVALRNMDERELRDIGISRSDIEAAVGGTLRRPRH